MSKIRVIEIISLIKNNLVSFISICFFVVLAVGLFLGLGNAAKATESSLFGYMEENNLHDIDMILPYGITDDEFKQISAVDGVDSIEKAPYSYEWFSIGNDDYQTMVSKVPEDVDRLSLRKGRLPEKKGEIVIEETWAKSNNLSIGDTISFEKNYKGDTDMLTKIATYSDDVDDLEEYLDEDDNSPSMEYLTTSEYVITGLVESPTRICSRTVKNDAVTNGIPVDVQTFVTEDSFRNDQFAFCNRVIVSSDALRGYGYKDPTYKSKSTALKERLQASVDSIYEDKNNQITDNKHSIEQRWQNEIDDGENDIREAENKYGASVKKLTNKKKELKQGKQLLASSQQELNASIGELNKSKSDLAELEATFGSDDPQVKAGKKAIAEAEKKINAAKNEISTKKANISSAEGKISSAESQLASAKSEIEENKNKLADAKANLEKFAGEEIESMDASVLDREFNGNYSIPEHSNDMIENMKSILAGTFVIIGLLVCFSAISRFVNQQLKLVGTKKALGMRKGEIQNTFLLFTGISVTLGCIIGAFVIAPIIQVVILNAMSNTFNIGQFTWTFNVKDTLLISFVEIAALLAVTWLTVRRKLGKSVISLLAGPEPPSQKQHAYEKLWVWKRLPLFTKTIINNSTTDLTRIIATVVGIAGATALLVISFTIYNNVVNNIETHFSEYFHFDSVIKVEEPDKQTEKDIKAVLEKHNANGTEVYWKSTSVEVEKNDLTSLKLIVPENQEEFDNLVEIYDSEGGSKLDARNGFLCVYSMYNWYGDKAKSFNLADSYGEMSEAEVKSFFDSYLITGFMIADKSTYADIFGEESVPNAFIADTSKVKDLDSLKADLRKVEGYKGMTDFIAESSYRFSVVQNLVKVLVAVYLLISIVMSVLIVLNLLNQFIAEKKNELIVLRINGYGIKDAKRYIFTDTIIIGIISIILGTVIGSILGNMAISAFDAQMTYLLRQINYPACFIGMGISAILTFLMSAISLRQISKLKLSDINQ